MSSVGTAVSASELEALRHARGLALGGYGRVSPNPLVGAVVLRGGAIVGSGWHEGPGTAHAEVAALREAGALARGATVVCTLEPCSHHGRTPPCTDALVSAGVARVVIGSLDPLERGRDGGAAVLAAAGVDVVIAPEPESAECRLLNAPFITHAITGRPFVTLKMAASLDGRVATDTGETRWITGEAARRLVHRWRAGSDAVAVGIGTALADDPLLTAREVEGEFRPPLRVVFDSAARLPVESALAGTSGDHPVVVVARPGADAARLEALQDAGVDVQFSDGIETALELLGARGVQSLFLEGGPTLARGFLAAGAVDAVEWFVAPVMLGGDTAPSALAGAALGPLADVPRLRHVTSRLLGEDVLISGRLTDLPEG